jgi:hypothetical protein
MEVRMNDEEEKRLLESYRKLSPDSQRVAFAQIMARLDIEKNG